MKTLERVLTALNHRQPDKVPYDIRFTQKAHAKMAQYYGDPEFESKLGNCFTWFRPYPRNVRYRLVGPDIWQDEFGVRWNRTIDKDIGVPCNQLVTPQNINEFQWPDPNDPTRYDFIKEAVKKAGDRKSVV